MRRFLVAAVLSLTVVAAARPSPDGDYLVPVDHVWGLPGQVGLKAIYPADYRPLLGAMYRGYFILDGYSYGWYDDWHHYQSETRDLIFSGRDRHVGEDGYCYYSGGYGPRVDPMILLTGGDSVIPVGRWMHSDPGRTFAAGSGISPFFSAKTWFFRRQLEDGLKYSSPLWIECPHGVWDDGIESIVPWSTLAESVRGVEIRYAADRMRHPFYSFGDMELNFDNASLFWAEGEKGPGTGGIIDVVFKRKADHVMVLNGAVDLARLNLYKDNNRLRRVLVVGDDGAFSIEYEFEDIVRFHEIEFPEEVGRIRITILEVYKGGRWDDTCVSAIFLKQPPLRSRPDYDAVIEAYIRLRGFDKLIERYERSRGGKKSQS